MAIPKFPQDLAIISKLGDNPGSDNNLTTSGLRAKFDEAGLAIQNYINNTLIPALSGLANPEEGLNMKANIDMGGHKVTELGTPTAEGDAVPLGYANQNFAPAGYGLGESVFSNVDVTTKAGLDALHGTGWFCYDGEILADGFTGTCFVYQEETSSIFKKQEITDLRGLKIVRSMQNGVWNPFEWPRPPMLPGVEYRTTERFNDKPVYAKTINFGTMPNTSTTEINHYISNLGYVVEKIGTAPGYYFPIAWGDSNYGNVEIRVSPNSVAIKSSADWSEYNCVVMLKYTKTTD